MNDHDLLGYLEIHARTELGLVHQNHIVRLLELAGEHEHIPHIRTRQWWYTDQWQIDPLVKKARARMSQPEDLGAWADKALEVV